MPDCGGCWRREAGGGPPGAGGGVLCDWLGECIWLSLTDPKLEVGARIGEAGRYWSKPDCLGPIAAGTVAQTGGWRLRVRLLLPYVVWPLSVWIFSLSVSLVVK